MQDRRVTRRHSMSAKGLSLLIEETEDHTPVDSGLHHGTAFVSLALSETLCPAKDTLPRFTQAVSDG